MAAPFKPTERLPGETLVQFTDRVLARARGESVPPPAAPAPPRMPLSPEDEQLAALNAAATVGAKAQDEAHGPDGLNWFKAPKASFGATVGHVVEKLRYAAGRVWNPKIHCADVKIPGRFVRPPKNWDRDVLKDFRAKRVKGDVRVNTFKGVVATMHDMARHGRGFVQSAYAGIAQLSDCCSESFRKVLRWVEDNGWVGTFNALYRDEDGALKRDANVYLLFGKQEAVEISETPPEDRGLKREARTLSRGASLFGLVVRAWGLNATPPPSNRHNLRTAPAPA
jgi:hypothetical protein